MSEFIRIKNRDTGVVSTVNAEIWKYLKKSNKQRILEETKEPITKTVNITVGKRAGKTLEMQKDKEKKGN